MEGLHNREHPLRWILVGIQKKNDHRGRSLMSQSVELGQILLQDSKR